MTKAGESILRGAREALEYAKGEHDGFIAHVPDNVDVRAIRQATKLSQVKFAATFGFSPAAIRNWEQNRRHPDTAVRAYLMVIEHDSSAVMAALAEQSRKKTTAAA